MWHWAGGGGLMLLAADEDHAANRLRDLERVPSTVPKALQVALV